MKTEPRLIGDALSALAVEWRTRASDLRGWGAGGNADTLERAANELDAALRGAETEPLTLAQAARESGYSTDHLARLIRQGKLANVGRDRAPRVRRADLPRKTSDGSAPRLAAATAGDASLSAIARSAIAGKITGARR